MEMKIDSKLIVKLRKAKGWSQQHLSDVSGVSLRTIQRVENEGNTSVETLKSLASSFETDFNNLILTSPPANNLRKKTTFSFVLFLCLAMSVFITSTTTASPGVEIQAEKIIVSQDERETTFLGNVSMVIPSGVPFEISTIESHPVESQHAYQLKIITEDSSFLVSDARITNVEIGLEVVAEKIRTSNTTI